MAYIEPNLPVFWGHGTADNIVTLATAEESITFLTETLQYSEEMITFKVYDSLDHTVNDVEIEDLAHWLMGILG